MKKLIMIICLMIFLCACTRNVSEKESNTYIYASKEINFTLEIPHSWEEKVGIIENKSSVTFFWMNADNIYMPLFEILENKKIIRYSLDYLEDEDFVDQVLVVIESLKNEEVIINNEFHPLVYINTSTKQTNPSDNVKLRIVTIAVANEYDTYQYKKGAIDQSGNIVINPEYTHISEFKDEIATGFLDDYQYIFNAKGDITFATNQMVLLNAGEDKVVFAYKNSNEAYDFSNYGYMNTKGEVIIPAQFDIAYAFSEGVALVRDVDGEEHYIDGRGQKTELMEIETNNNFVDDKLETLKADYEDVKYIFEGFYAYREDGLWGIIDYKNEVISEPIYNSMSNMHEGIAQVTFNGLNAAINSDNNVIWYQIIPEKSEFEFDQFLYTEYPYFEE